MDVQPGSKPAKKGSMVPFWVIIGFACLVLVAYIALFVGRGARLMVLGGPMDPGARRAVPPAMLVPVNPPGDPVQLLTLKGDVVVLHFWATWCPPCRAEFPDFAKYATSGDAPRGVEIFAISLDQKTDPIPPFLEDLPKSPMVFTDPEGLSEQLGITGIPTTVLVDKAGRIAWRSAGVADWSPTGVPSVIDKLVKE
jgi:thiol-disulfide isomerase/thioredoxin